MKKKLAIIGGGTSALFLAAFINTELFDVTIYEKKASLGRKFLVAGDGGFNLSHSEDLPNLKLQYKPNSYLDEVLDSFSNIDMRAWLLELGIPTFVGSSGRIFPEKGIKPIEVLKKMEEHLANKNVNFEFNMTFTGWSKQDSIEFNSNEIVKADYAVFALGGSSWKVTGSDGTWLDIFRLKGIDTVPFGAINCAFQVKWNKDFLQKNEGKPLKNISFSLENQTQKGEVVITKFGIEGNAIYGLSSKIQSNLTSNTEVVVHADFKPTYTVETLIEKLSRSESNTTATLRDKIKLSNVQLDLIKLTLTKEQFMDVPTLAKFIKSFPISISGSAPIDEAISTLGGINLNDVDSNFELLKLKNQFCIGEMLDWSAPTGGYLIQGCASQGVYLAHSLNKQ